MFSVPAANGDLYTKEDIRKVKEMSGCSSVMLARGALADLSVFMPPSVPQKPIEDIIKDYLRRAAAVGNLHANTKYTAWQMLLWRGEAHTDLSKAITR